MDLLICLLDPPACKIGSFKKVQRWALFCGRRWARAFCWRGWSDEGRNAGSIDLSQQLATRTGRRPRFRLLALLGA